MRVVGIDLAASPATTGVVVLDDGAGSWAARAIAEEADDDLLVDVVRGAGAVGVDAPLGWPDAFVAAVAAHHRFEHWSGTTDRRPMTHRRTDVVTRDIVGRYPLSVSADLLGVVAMRAALLQQRWADEVWGRRAARDGSGPLSETYPAAAFAAWGIACRGYKARGRPEEARAVRGTIVRELARSTDEWLALDTIAELAVENDHVLDALVCALVALAVVTGATTTPSAGGTTTTGGFRERARASRAPRGPRPMLLPAGAHTHTRNGSVGV